MSNLDQIDSVNVNLHNRGVKSATQQQQLQLQQNELASTSDISKSKKPKSKCFKLNHLEFRSK
jgi:hypothetical protein